MGYGGDRSRYQETKRAVENKHMGPLISTIMTRCIHCTRCVRFSTEVAGVNDMGAIGRGESMEITTYLEKALASELSGNVVDLCPVGALTNRPYAFNARPWELSHTETVDAMDAMGAAIRVDTRGNEVMRVLPRINDDINEEWISDKTRHAHDGLLRQRLDRPYLRKGDGRLHEASWEEAFAAIKSKTTKAKQIGAIAGDQCDAESMFALKSLMQALGSSNIDCRQDGSVLGGKGRGGYVFNSSFNGLEDTDFILLIGANPRHEAAVMNARIRRRWLDDGLEVARIGTPVDLTYPVAELGDDASILSEIAAGDHPVSRKLKRAKKPMLIIGAGACNRDDSKAILNAASMIASEFGVVDGAWNGFNVLHTAAGRVGGLDMGFIPDSKGMDTKAMLKAAKSGQLDMLYLLAADEMDLNGIDASCFVIYQGSHGDAGARIADVILPGAAWCEKDALFVNTEGRVQHAQRATFPPGDAREDWAIIRALSAVLGKTLGFDNHDELREVLYTAIPGFADQGGVAVNAFKPQGRKGTITSTPLQHAIGPGSGRSFYMTCPTSRHSTTMAACIEALEDEMKGAAE